MNAAIETATSDTTTSLNRESMIKFLAKYVTTGIEWISENSDYGYAISTGSYADLQVGVRVENNWRYEIILYDGHEVFTTSSVLRAANAMYHNLVKRPQTLTF